MESKLSVKPTDSELEILQVLWRSGPSTVREVNDCLNRVKRVGYTTTLKLLQIMTEKGLVSRDEKSRTHIYRAAVGREATQDILLTRLLDIAFSGSASKLVIQALGNHNATTEELREIKELINRLEKDNE